MKNGGRLTKEMELQLAKASQSRRKNFIKAGVSSSGRLSWLFRVLGSFSEGRSMSAEENMKNGNRECLLAADGRL